LRLYPDGQSWAVVIDGRPEYQLTVVPAEGKHTCEVLQTNNGRRLASGPLWDTAELALGSGLDDLRKSLGW
jgi:hypothetical protein